MDQQPKQLDYVPPHLHRQNLRPPITPLILLGTGVVICAFNLVGTVRSHGDYMLAPALGLLSFLLFVLGLILAWVGHRRRRRHAGLVMILHFGGIISSIVLSCAGMPKR